MKLGFSTLSLFMKNYEEIISIAREHEFNSIELLCEGPYMPLNLLNKPSLIKHLKDTDLTLYIHAPTVDLNLASLNSRIREVSIELILETIDFAHEINATIITIHPGQIGRNDSRLREYALQLSKDSISKLVDYGEEKSVIISIENMPSKFSFLANKVEELQWLIDETGSNATIDIGHSNTCNNTSEFLNLKKISYCHLNDNNGTKDSHWSLGEGTLDLNLLKRIDNGIIELNDFNNVLKSKDIISKVV